METIITPYMVEKIIGFNVENINREEFSKSCIIWMENNQYQLNSWTYTHNGISYGRAYSENEHIDVEATTEVEAIIKVATYYLKGNTHG